MLAAFFSALALLSTLCLWATSRGACVGNAAASDHACSPLWQHSLISLNLSNILTRCCIEELTGELKLPHKSGKVGSTGEISERGRPMRLVAFFFFPERAAAVRGSFGGRVAVEEGFACRTKQMGGSLVVQRN